MNLFNRNKSNKTENVSQVKHLQSGPWHQFDILLKTSPYGWNEAVMYVDYLIKNDLINISTLGVSEMVGGEMHELISLLKCSNNIKDISEIAKENGVLSVGGESQQIKAPIKIVFFNQSNALRIFSLCGDEKIIQKYVDKMISKLNNFS